MSELNLIPDGWKIVKLGDYFEFTKKPRNLKIAENELIPFIPMDIIPEDKREIINWQYKTFAEISSGTFVYRDDLIVAKITPSFENGKQVILCNLPTSYGYATTEVWALHSVSEDANTEYLYNFLKIPEVRKGLASKMEGATGRQRLPRAVLDSLLILLPPTEEQKNIVKFLSTIQIAKLKAEAEMKALDSLYKSVLPPLMAGDFRVKDLEIPV